MKLKEQTNWTCIAHDLKMAALVPQQRVALLGAALQQVSANLPALGAALIWPCKEKKVPWTVYYAGGNREAMQRWLAARLDPSLAAMMAVFQQSTSLAPLNSAAPPLLFPLRLQATLPAALWLIWPQQSTAETPASPLFDQLPQISLLLEAVLEVASKEEQYFAPTSPLSDRELLADLAHGDKQALSAFLSLTRVVTNADFAFWAQAYQDIVEITGHLGARHSGFGFSLQRGQGVGGRVAAYGTMVIGDYRNSPYRDSSVSEVIDGELIRSGIALPVRYSTTHDGAAHVAAVLYATRRGVSRFSMAECLLMQRLARTLEPLPFLQRPASFAVPGLPHLADHKAAWYAMTLHSTRIEDVESWISQFIKGQAIIVDSKGAPYMYEKSAQLDQLRAQYEQQQGNGVYQLSLEAPGVAAPGQVYLASSIPLPPPRWPDFFADLVMVCNLVISRMERAQDQLHRQRKQWLHHLLQAPSAESLANDGYRLGLPVEGGQVWVLAWPTDTMQALQSARKRMTAENVVLDLLKSPLLFLEEDIAVILLARQTLASATQVRNALLASCGAQPLWIVQGGQYRELAHLRLVLTHALALAQKARRERYGEYLLDLSLFGLDSLLENPALTRELQTFAERLLAPLSAYDRANGTNLTETLVLARTLGSAQAVSEQLAVHVNTVRYRLHRAEELLGRDQTLPKEQTATSLAAFIWLAQHAQELSAQHGAGVGERA